MSDAKIPPIVAKAFNVAETLEGALKTAFPLDVLELYPVVPFVAEYVASKTFIWIGLIGDLAARCPPRCSALEQFRPFLSVPKFERAKEIEEKVRHAFLDEGFRLSGVGFESAARVQVAGGYTIYFH